MSVIHARVRLGHTTRSFDLKHKTITIGKAPSCVLRLNVPWLEDQHLVIDNSDDLVRLKCAGLRAKARLSGSGITTDWTLLPSSGRITVIGPDGKELLIDFSCSQPQYNAVVLQDETCRIADSGDDQAAPIVTASPLDQKGWNSPPKAQETMVAPVAPKVEKRLLSRLEYVVMGVAFGILAIVLATILYNQHTRSAQTDIVKADTKWVIDHLTQAEDLLQKREYVAAKAALDAAEPKARKYPSLSYERGKISDLRNTDEIKLGAAGYVKMEGRWLSAETAKAWQSARERDDPKIASLEQQALDAQRNKKFDEARLACEDALALVDKHPVKPHPKEKALRTLLETVKNESIADEMTTKGFVLYDNKWVTPTEKFKLEQLAKGLVEYQGKWLPKDEAFAAEQTDKGLVLYQGRWMTPDEKMQADGFVQFEGRWVKPEEKQAAMAKQREEARQEAHRIATGGGPSQVTTAPADEMKKNAYLMSQVFVKKQLKTSGRAIFQEYDSATSNVVLKDGWYIVKAIVTSGSGSGALIRNVYYCKLRPTPGKANVWESELTFLE